MGAVYYFLCCMYAMNSSRDILPSPFLSSLARLSSTVVAAGKRRRLMRSACKALYSARSIVPLLSPSKILKKETICFNLSWLCASCKIVNFPELRQKGMNSSSVIVPDLSVSSEANAGRAFS
eukprot:TRINITY_DN16822_c0_g1_i2.p2 TRINITY_DN16822_c0_g1~~TRINITY_DN16822_c0_g1_i2.p2  ORF type:complete len:122 (+),score=11.04 TRINITY_DN16822_c0_g1_i2:67-432(+)